MQTPVDKLLKNIFNHHNLCKWQLCFVSGKIITFSGTKSRIIVSQEQFDNISVLNCYYLWVGNISIWHHRLSVWAHNVVRIDNYDLKYVVIINVRLYMVIYIAEED